MCTPFPKYAPFLNETYISKTDPFGFVFSQRSKRNRRVRIGIPNFQNGRQPIFRNGIAENATFGFSHRLGFYNIKRNQNQPAIRPIRGQVHPAREHCTGAPVPNGYGNTVLGLMWQTGAKRGAPLAKTTCSWWAISRLGKLLPRRSADAKVSLVRPAGSTSAPLMAPNAAETANQANWANFCHAAMRTRERKQIGQTFVTPQCAREGVSVTVAQTQKESKLGKLLSRRSAHAMV